VRGARLRRSRSGEAALRAAAKWPSRAPDATLLLREGSRVREGPCEGTSGALLRHEGLRVVRDVRAAGALGCATRKRHPSWIHASRALCCIVFTSSCGEGNHADAVGSRLKSTGGSPWRRQAVLSGLKRGRTRRKNKAEMVKSDKLDLTIFKRVSLRGGPNELVEGERLRTRAACAQDRKPPAPLFNGGHDRIGPPLLRGPRANALNQTCSYRVT